MSVQNEATMSIGDVFYNTVEEKALPGVPDFKIGYYKIISIYESWLRKKLKPDERLVYEIRRCTKDGMKLMKYSNSWTCKQIDAWLESGRLKVCGDHQCDF